MTKSIKLKDNTYIDSTGVVHERGLLSTLLNSILGRTYIQESGSNSNGNYIKYSNGIMICYGTRSYSPNVNVAWGVLYESQAINFGDFPVAFIERPHVTASIVDGRACLIEMLKPSTASLGNSWFARPDNAGNINVTMSYIAIGKWK